MPEAEVIIHNNGEVFERVLRDSDYRFAVASDGRDWLQRSVGRAHVNIRLPRTAGTTTSEQQEAERTGVGTLQFYNQGPLGPPFTLVGKPLTMRLDDGRTLDFMFCDGGNIIDARVWCSLHRNVRCAGGCGRKHPELDESGGDGERH